MKVKYVPYVESFGMVILGENCRGVYINEKGEVGHFSNTQLIFGEEMEEEREWDMDQDTYLIWINNIIDLSARKSYIARCTGLEKDPLEITRAILERLLLNPLDFLD